MKPLYFLLKRRFTGSCHERVRKGIEIEKGELIANGVDSTFVTVTLNDCNGNAIPYEESLGFKVSSTAGAKIAGDQYDFERDKYSQYYNEWGWYDDEKLSPSSSSSVGSDGSDISVKVTAPPSDKVVKDTISFQVNDASGKMSCYRDPVTVNLTYEPQAELRLEVENSSADTIVGDGKTWATIKATVVLPGGKVASNFNGRVRFYSVQGLRLSNQDVDVYQGVARTYIQPINSNDVKTGDITAEIINSDSRYQNKLASILNKTHHLEVLYEPDLQIDNSCTREKPEVAFIIDSSGSMNQNDPQRLRVGKSQELISKINSLSNIGTKFNSTGSSWLLEALRMFHIH